MTDRPKKNKIYLNYPYRDDKEQCFDMLFWNEKFLSELFKYNRLDDGIPRILEIIEAYKQRLKDRGLYYETDYINYVKAKLSKIKEIIQINEKWAEIENTGIDDFSQLIGLDKDKRRINKLESELGTFKELLYQK